MLNMTDVVGVLTENKRAMWEEILARFSLRQKLYSAILPILSRPQQENFSSVSLSCRKSNYIATQQIYLISTFPSFICCAQAF